MDGAGQPPDRRQSRRAGGTAATDLRKRLDPVRSCRRSGGRPVSGVLASLSRRDHLAPGPLGECGQRFRPGLPRSTNSDDPALPLESPDRHGRPHPVNVAQQQPTPDEPRGFEAQQRVNHLIVIKQWPPVAARPSRRQRAAQHADPRQAGAAAPVSPKRSRMTIAMVVTVPNCRLAHWQNGARDYAPSGSCKHSGMSRCPCSTRQTSMWSGCSTWKTR